MTDITRTYPDPVNVDALIETVRQTYPQVTQRSTEFVVHNVTDDQPTNDLINAIIAAHDDTVLTENQQNTALENLTRNDAIVYFRDGLAAAAGNGAVIASLYTDARNYEQQNQMLTDTMLTLRTIEETALGLPLVLTTNQDKARYLKLFLMALALWS
jgi:hypothetical protein